MNNVVPFVSKSDRALQEFRKARDAYCAAVMEWYAETGDKEALAEEVRHTLIEMSKIEARTGKDLPGGLRTIGDAVDAVIRELGIVEHD